MKLMRILILAWEYPPMLVGGLGRHVYGLSKAMAGAGHSVHIITTHVDGIPDYEYEHNVHIHRVKSSYEDRSHFDKWIAGLNEAMIQYAKGLCNRTSFDLIHAHDWLVYTAAKAIKYEQNLPIVATIHATEHGRNNGVHTSLQWEIHMKEKELVKEAEMVIVCSQYMKREVQKILDVPLEKLVVFPNGIDADFFEIPSSFLQSARQKYNLTNRTVAFSIGRIVSEKGFYTIIESAPALIHRFPHLVFIIAGKGPMLEEYRHIVSQRGLHDFVQFIGHISEEDQRAFLQESDLIVIPSLYEPFGIVALEGMLAKKTIIVSDVGGLSEIVEHEQTGFKIMPGDAQSLICQITAVLNNEEGAKQVALNGHKYVIKYYNWRTIAAHTAQIYERITHKISNGEGL